MGKQTCALSLFWSSIMVGNTNINSIVVRQRNMSPKAAYGNVCTDITAQHTLLNGRQFSSRTAVCNVYFLSSKPHFFALLCDVGTGLTVTSSPQPAGSWTLPREGTGRAQKQELLLFRDVFSGWIKTEKNGSRNGGKTRSFIVGWAKRSQKTPKVGCQIPNSKRKPQEKRPTGS